MAQPGGTTQALEHGLALQIGTNLQFTITRPQWHSLAVTRLTTQALNGRTEQSEQIY